MNAIVVYESIYGNTRAIAEAVAHGLGGVEVTAVQEARPPREGVDLLVVGGPTHMHGMASAHSRRMAIDAAGEDGHAAVQPGAGDGPGLRRWLAELPRRDVGLAAAFDTRLDRSPMLTGMAARGIARRLRRRGYELAGTESFLVEDTEGPLDDGELERARAWGAELAGRVGVGATTGEPAPTGHRA